MPSIKEYDVKLKSLKSTRKITKTMKMVAASKLRRAQESQRNARPYASRVHELVGRLVASVGTEAHPLLTPRVPPKKALLLLYTSDKGLCGGFNGNLIKLCTRWLAQQQRTYEDVAMSFCGRRGYAYFRNRVKVARHYEESTVSPDFATGHAIALDIIQDFLAGAFDEVFMVYSQFRSALSQAPTLQKILPIAPAEVAGEGRAFSIDYIFEPPQAEILSVLLPRTITVKVLFALLENAAGEHGSRMTAMDSATANASKLIDEYTLRRNRARQAAITTELTEIVAGAEAL